MANIGCGARIAVVAALTFIHRYHFTLAACRLAGVFLTGGVLGGVADSDGGWIKYALVRHHKCVTNESAVTEISILKLGAIFSSVAFAGLRTGLARAVLAGVAHSASVAVVTRCAAKFAVLATERLVANIQRALVAIIAVKRRGTDAYPAFTLVN